MDDLFDVLLVVLRGVHGLHGIDNDADEQVEHGEGGHQDEGNEEQPGIGVLGHHRTHDAHGPAFQCHDLEQGIDGGD